MLTHPGQTIVRKEPCDIIEALREVRPLVSSFLPQGVPVKVEFPREAMMPQKDKTHRAAQTCRPKVYA